MILGAHCDEVGSPDMLEGGVGCPGIEVQVFTPMSDPPYSVITLPRKHEGLHFFQVVASKFHRLCTGRILFFLGWMSSCNYRSFTF